MVHILIQMLNNRNIKNHDNMKKNDNIFKWLALHFFYLSKFKCACRGKYHLRWNPHRVEPRRYNYDPDSSYREFGL
jgi:hypothetical protein